MKSQTILMADDDKELLNRLKESLTRINGNCKVKEVYDGKSALNVLKKEEIDLLILAPDANGIDGRKLLNELYKDGMWVPVLLTTNKDTENKESVFTEFGVTGFITKPFFPEDVARRIDEILLNRAKKDIIKNFSLPSILQLIDMEKRTGILTVEIGGENGRLFFKGGKVMDIRVKGMSTKEALDQFIHSFYDDREISIEYIEHFKGKKVDMSLIQMVIEASRIKDETHNKSENSGLFDLEELAAGKTAPKKNDEDLPALNNMLESFKEVQNYIVTGSSGDVLAVSSGGEDDDMLNLGIYLWTIGGMLGETFKLGDPGGLICHFKDGRKLIKKYNEYIIILELTKITKYSAFKEKLDIELSRLASRAG